jgi:hypothetical protein
MNNSATTLSSTPMAVEGGDAASASFQPDSIVRTVIGKFLDRAQFGKQKYGTDLDRQDLDVLDWVQHAQEEHMDAILYLEKLKQTLLQQRTSK